MQIGELDLVHEPTPVVDERLLEEVNLATQLPTAKVGLYDAKDIEAVKRLASPEGLGESVLKGTETLFTSPTHSEHSVEGHLFSWRPRKSPLLLKILVLR